MITKIENSIWEVDSKNKFHCKIEDCKIIIECLDDDYCSVKFYKNQDFLELKCFNLAIAFKLVQEYIKQNTLSKFISKII